MRTLREYRDPFFHVTLLDDYRNMSPMVRGSFVGCMFQRKLVNWLNMTQPLAYREGVGSEPDIVCLFNADFSFEVKTSCSKGNAINGNRVQATANKPPRFLLYINYHPDTLTIRDVRLGWCGPDDWAPTTTTGHNSQAARLKPEIVSQFVSVPIHGNLCMVYAEHDRNETVVVDYHDREGVR